MSKNLNLEDDEINLGELFAALWAHKLTIVLITGLSIVLAGYYISTAKKKFTAHATFQIKQNNDSGINITSEMGALASLAGLVGGGVVPSSKTLLERLQRREFILSVSDTSFLDQDPYFNTYNPNYKDPYWKEIIKKILVWNETDAELKSVIENTIIKNYLENVTFKETKGGAITVTVTHPDPKRASEYANIFMLEIQNFVEAESKAAQNFRLSYLSETLADALQEMDTAQEKLKDFALKNSTMAQENFLSGSLKLDQIRMEKRKVEEIGDLLLILEGIIESGNLDNKSYETLRLRHPLVDDIEFRRILGMSETISAWAWPDIETIKPIRTTLADRVKRLDVDIKNIEENAKIYASSAEDLTKISRDARIAEATYTVLIEQVKSQTLAAGFQPETFKVFEYATPPLSPSLPRRKLILLLGAVFGILIGSGLALIIAISKGVYYTKKALISETNADLALRAKIIRRSAHKSIDKIVAIISKKRAPDIDEAGLQLADKKLIYIFNSGGKLNASDAARVLAAQSSQSGRNVVICDTTGQSEKEINVEKLDFAQSQPIVKISENINIMAGANSASFFTSANFNTTIKELLPRFEQIFICSNKNNSNLGLMALKSFSPGFVLIASLRKTRKLDIQTIKNNNVVYFSMTRYMKIFLFLFL